MLAPGASRFSGGAEDLVELFFVHHFDAIVVEEEPTVVVFRETHVVTVIWTRSYVHYDCEKIVTSLVDVRATMFGIFIRMKRRLDDSASRVYQRLDVLEPLQVQRVLWRGLNQHSLLRLVKSAASIALKLVDFLSNSSLALKLFRHAVMDVFCATSTDKSRKHSSCSWCFHTTDISSDSPISPRIRRVSTSSSPFPLARPPDIRSPSFLTLVQQNSKTRAHPGACAHENSTLSFRRRSMNALGARYPVRFVCNDIS